MPLGFIALDKAIEVVGKDKFRAIVNKLDILLAIVCILPCVVFSYFRSSNSYMLKFSRMDLPQYKIAEVINKHPNATMISNRCMDNGVYTTTGIIPNCKYFYGLNINLPEINAVQDDYLNEGRVDFAVTDKEQDFLALPEE